MVKVWFGVWEKDQNLGDLCHHGCNNNHLVKIGEQSGLKETNVRKQTAVSSISYHLVRISQSSLSLVRLQRAMVAAKSSEKMAKAYFLKWSRVKRWHQVEGLSSQGGTEGDGRQREVCVCVCAEKNRMVNGHCSDVSIFS